MEVKEKKRDDVKGGNMIKYENKMRMIEIEKVKKENVDDFK
jgi:UTP--glucose-1-phosphate uridylyltransferase